MLLGFDTLARGNLRKLIYIKLYRRVNYVEALIRSKKLISFIAFLAFEKLITILLRSRTNSSTEIPGQDLHPRSSPSFFYGLLRQEETMSEKKHEIVRSARSFDFLRGRFFVVAFGVP